MNKKPNDKRRHPFIAALSTLATSTSLSKKFQANFLLKFFMLILLEVFLAIGIFAYIARGTLTTGVKGFDLHVVSTTDYFLSTFSTLNLIVAALMGVTGAIVFILISHKIAGPLFRCQKVLKETTGGNLTLRCHLRNGDQAQELGEAINTFVDSVEKNILETKSNLSESLEVFNEVQNAVTSGRQKSSSLETNLKKLSEHLHQLKDMTDHFKVSENKK